MKKNFQHFLGVLSCIILLLSIFPQYIYAQSASQTETLFGSETGLFRLSGNFLLPLWQNGSVQKIIYANGWYFLTSEGIIFSNDLKTFQPRNNGIASYVVKEYDGETINFIEKTHPLKDFEVLPGSNNIFVTVTKDEVFITRDAGLHWTSLGFNARTNGTKAVSVAMLPISNAANAPETLTVFLSHSIYGTAYIQPDSTNPVWTDITNGFEALSTLDNMDEVSDILAVQERQSNGTYKTEVYFTQSFLPRLYRLNWTEKKAELIAQSSEPLNTWDSLTQVGSDLAFVTMNDTIRFFSPTSETFIDTQKSSAKRAVSDILKKSKTTPNCAWLPSSITGISNAFGLSELWMTDTQGLSNKYSRLTEDKRSLYVPSSELRTQAGMTKYIDTLKENNLNSLVVDMKDDKGVLRYQSEDPLVKEKAFTSRYALDIENFIQTFKNNDIYLIARIVVFKDPNLYAYNNGKYAVWDNTTNAPWLGIRGYTEEQTATYYDEQWVDPYSHEVWEYNVAIAKELIALGFDEIQFDYIRFPTDGYNLDNASYRWQDAGMEKESALVSFLSYARKNIQAPIGVDIYGVNGWYRSGSRTGQEVELLAPYVDVICPMFYPSHFEQYFLAYEPIAERPYRIYFYGTYRNAVIARNKVLIRPWLQSFYLNVSYDREFYDSDYVQRQVFGVRDATDTGYMYWNNVGRYDEVRPDIGTAQENTPYPWKKATHEEIDSIPVFLNN